MGNMKVIHKQKNPFGGEIYTDENFRVVGYGRKNIFGGDTLLDKDFRYSGEKRKGLFGETVYLDRNWKVKGYSRKTSLGNTVYVDRDFHYKGRGGSIGEEEYLLLEEDAEDVCENGRRGISAGVFLAAVLIGIVIVLWTVLK